MRASKSHFATVSIRRPGGLRRGAAPKIEAIEARLLLSQIEIFPTDPFETVKSRVASAVGGDFVHFNKAVSGQSTYSFPDRLDLHGSSNGLTIEYYGDPATYDPLTGAVIDPGTVITKDLSQNPHDHYVFDVKNTTLFNNIKIHSLTFEGCGVGFFDGSCDNLRITNVLARNGVPDPESVPAWIGAIEFTTGLTNSSIDHNVFINEQMGWGIYFDGGVYNNVHFDNTPFPTLPAAFTDSSIMNPRVRTTTTPSAETSASD